MVKIGALLAALLLLVSLPFAETYSKKYVSDGWLEITRTINVGTSGACPLSQQGVSDACMHSGASQATGNAGAALTQVTLSVKNVGVQDKEYVNLGESLSYVPLGAEISFSPSPSQFDGRQAVWQIAQIGVGETREFSYSFTSSVGEAAVGRVPDATIASAPSTVMLYAPSRLPMNGTLTLSLKSSEGKPISGARILVNYPDGTRQGVKTDASGTASITASRKGSYTYSVEGYKLSQIVSTVAYDPKEEEAAIPATAAAAADTGLLPGIIGALPVLAAIFAVAVVMLIIYNFLAAKREEDESAGPAPQLAEQQAQAMPSVNYTQKFSFAQDAEREKKMDDTTRSLVESRKRRMQDEAPAQSEYEAEAPVPKQQEADIEQQLDDAEAEIYTDSEKTVAGSAMDDEIAELEKNARIAGEVAQQEKEVENMLLQLEQIRNKLRAGRGAPGDAEIEEPAGRPRPASRIAPKMVKRKVQAKKRK